MGSERVDGQIFAIPRRRAVDDAGELSQIRLQFLILSVVRQFADDPKMLAEIVAYRAGLVHVDAEISASVQSSVSRLLRSLCRRSLSI